MRAMYVDERRMPLQQVAYISAGLLTTCKHVIKN